MGSETEHLAAKFLGLSAEKEPFAAEEPILAEAVLEVLHPFCSRSHLLVLQKSGHHKTFQILLSAPTIASPSEPKLEKMILDPSCRYELTGVKSSKRKVELTLYEMDRTMLRTKMLVVRTYLYSATALAYALEANGITSQMHLSTSALVQPAASSKNNVSYLSKLLSMKPVATWTSKDVKRWLRKWHFFADCSQRNSLQCNKKTSKPSSNSKFVKLFVDRFPDGSSLLHPDEQFVRDLSCITLPQQVQLMAEIFAIKKAERFDQGRRTVFQRLYQYSCATVTQCMERAEILCNASLIREKLLNPKDFADTKYEISLIIGTLDAGLFTDAVASVLHPTKLLPKYGIYHTALRIGPWIFEWDASSVCLPRPYANGLQNALLEYPIHDALDITKPQEKKMLEDLLVIVSHVMAKHNTSKKYSLLTCNCQHFVQEIMTKANLKETPHSAILDYLKEIRSTCYPTFKFKADSLINIHKTASAELKIPESTAIVFNSHALLDAYLANLSYLCKDSGGMTFEHKFPGEYLLLRGFCKAFSLRYRNIIHSSSSANNEEVMQLYCHHETCKYN